MNKTTFSSTSTNAGGGSSYNYLYSKGAVEGVYNATQGGEIQYKNPNQTTALTAQMDMPLDNICKGRNQLIIVGDRRVNSTLGNQNSTRRRNLQASYQNVSGSLVNVSLTMMSLNFNPDHMQTTQSIMIGF